MQATVCLFIYLLYGFITFVVPKGLRFEIIKRINCITSHYGRILYYLHKILGKDLEFLRLFLDGHT
jgi:hypothetical protein